MRFRGRKVHAGFRGGDGDKGLKYIETLANKGILLGRLNEVINL